MKRFLLAPVMLLGRILFGLAETFRFHYGKLNPYIFGMMMGSFPHKEKEADHDDRQGEGDKGTA